MLENGKNQSTSTEQLAGKTAESLYNVEQSFSNIVGSFGSLLSTNLNFLNKTDGALRVLLDTFNQLETQTGKLALSFGGSRDLVNAIRQSIVDAIPSVTELGGGIDDVVKIQTAAVKSLQTQTILNKDAYAELFAVAKLTTDGTKDVGQVTGDMIRKFTDAGYGIYNVGKEMTEVVKKAREIGVTTTAVVAELDKGLAKLNLYNFANGVQGMADMAAQAASLRIDMGSTLKLADALFEPDKAFEMAASFQRLGVQVTSLLDPYKLMDMARNDPAKLQESIIEATKSLVYFDEKNQRMAILPGAQGQLRELAALMGKSTEELANMAINAGDLDRKMKEIKFPAEFADEKSRKLIANMAQLKDGRYQVTFEDKDGQTITKAIEDLDKNDYERMEKMSERDPAKTAIDLQKEANGSLRNIENYTKAFQGIIPAQMAANVELNKTVSRTADFTRAGLEAGAKTLFGVERGKKGDLNIDRTTKELRGLSKDIGVMLSDFLSGKNVDFKPISTQFQKSKLLDMENFQKYFEEELEKNKKRDDGSQALPPNTCITRRQR